MATVEAVETPRRARAVSFDVVAGKAVKALADQVRRNRAAWFNGAPPAAPALHRPKPLGVRLD
jgi:hypothetical protein